MGETIERLPFTHRVERPLDSAPRRLLNTLFFDLHTRLGRNANLLGMLVIVGSSILSMFTSLQGIAPEVRSLIHAIEVGVTLMFALEYLLRLYAARWPLSYALSFQGMVDLMSWLPLLLFDQVFVAIRLLRVLRLLKLLRYLKAMRLFFASMVDVFDIVVVVMATICIIVLISGNLIHLIEPQTFPDAFIGCWWSLVTMTTVGYGDMVPVTPAGKFEAAALMLTGITMFALLTGTVTIKLTEYLNHKKQCPACRQHMSPLANYCPNCGQRQTDPTNAAE